MKFLIKFTLTLALSIASITSFGFSPFSDGSESAKKYALPTPYKVTVYAQHEIDSRTGIKTALYRYKFQNNSKEFVGQIELGEAPVDEKNHDSYFLGYQALDPYGKHALRPIQITAPNNWTYEIQKVDESNQYVIQWAIIGNNNSNVYGIAPGSAVENFSIRMPKADEKFTSTFMTGWFEYKPVLVDSFDKTPPKMSISMTSQTDIQRVGWLKVQVHSTVTDNYDSYPEVRLSEVTSADKTFKATDVDAVLGEETKVFWVKRSPNRHYAIKFTGMDASGNKVEQVHTLWAP